MIHRRMSIAIGSAALLAFIAPACSSDEQAATAARQFRRTSRLIGDRRGQQPRPAVQLPCQWLQD